jgi:HEAT repeat protein
VLLVEGIPSQRLTAAWALARTGDLDVVPDLIGALEDRNDDVAATADYGLRLLSRRLDGDGLPPEADAEQKRAAAGEWLRWYDSVRPAIQVDPAITSGRN